MSSEFITSSPVFYAHVDMAYSEVRAGWIAGPDRRRDGGGDVIDLNGRKPCVLSRIDGAG